MSFSSFLRPRTASLALLLLASACSSDKPKAAKDREPDKTQADSNQTSAAQLPPMPEGVVATVAGQPIDRSEFDALYEPEKARLLKIRSDGEVPQAYQAAQRKKLINELAWSRQLELEAERSGVDFEPEALAKLEAEGKRHIPDWEAWLERVGETPAIRRRKNADYLRERALLEARLGEPLAPSEEELRAAYEDNKDRAVAPEEMVRASHLLITYGPRDEGEKIQPLTAEQREAATPEQLAAWDAAALTHAERLREQALRPGVDFNELAREWSEGPGAYRGGDMGLFPRRQMVPEYAEAAFSLEVGAVSEPVKSDKGYYVIRVFGHYPPGPLPYEAVRADLVRQVEAQKYAKAKEALKRELDARFRVESKVLDEVAAYEAAKRRARGSSRQPRGDE